eukprot:1177799-Prorocentrum_minimum.AAC.2
MAYNCIITKIDRHSKCTQTMHSLWRKCNESNTLGTRLIFRIFRAYDVLSNKETRSIFDKYGEDGLKAGGGAPPPGESRSKDIVIV